MAFGIYGVRRHEEPLFKALAIRSPNWKAAEAALEAFEEANRLRVSEDRNKSFFSRVRNAFLNAPDSLVVKLSKVPMEVDVYAGNNRVSDGPAIRRAWLAERKKAAKAKAAAAIAAPVKRTPKPKEPRTKKAGK